jgi:hypothetical protein
MLRYGRDLTAKMGSIAYVCAATITLFAITAQRFLNPVPAQSPVARGG